jgi:hypothetical protein
MRITDFLFMEWLVLAFLTLCVLHFLVGTKMNEFGTWHAIRVKEASNNYPADTY